MLFSALVLELELKTASSFVNSRRLGESLNSEAGLPATSVLIRLLSRCRAAISSGAAGVKLGCRAVGSLPPWGVKRHRTPESGGERTGRERRAKVGQGEETHRHCTTATVRC